MAAALLTIVLISCDNIFDEKIPFSLLFLYAFISKVYLYFISSFFNFYYFRFDILPNSSDAAIKKLQEEVDLLKQQINGMQKGKKKIVIPNEVKVRLHTCNTVIIHLSPPVSENISHSV